MRIYKKFVLFLINKFLSGTHFFGIKRMLLNSLRFDVGNGTKIVGPIFCDGELHIGNDCWIGKHFSVDGNGKVFIGDNCDIAPDVKIVTGGHTIGNEKRRAGEGENYSITIGNGCWICTRVTIVGECVISAGVVVAANACVIKDVESNSMVGGIPAKLIKKL